MAFQLLQYLNASKTLLLLQPITVALVYVGTTLKDLSDVTHGWGEFSKTRWVRDPSFFPCINELFFQMMGAIFPFVDWIKL